MIYVATYIIIRVSDRARYPKYRKEVYMEDMKEFVAFSKKLLRVLKKIKLSLVNKDYETAEQLIDELIEDTQGDIEA
mgnify:FL=1